MGENDNKPISEVSAPIAENTFFYVFFADSSSHVEYNIFNLPNGEVARSGEASALNSRGTESWNCWRFGLPTHSEIRLLSSPPTLPAENPRSSFPLPLLLPSLQSPNVVI